jgi:hypothetical protein
MTSIQNLIQPSPKEQLIHNNGGLLLHPNQLNSPMGSLPSTFIIGRFFHPEALILQTSQQ